jgi:uncharacterized protein YggE
MENHPLLAYKKPFFALLSVMILTLIVFLAVLVRNEVKKYDYIGRSDQQLYTITIAGEGEVEAVPDIAQITLGVETNSAQVAVAQQENTQKVNQMIASLKQLGIEEKDIKTSQYSVYPQYDYPDGRQILRGYQISQSVTVKIRNFDNIGKALEMAGSAGVNQVGGLSFTIDDPEGLRQQARVEALQNAKSKAEELAKNAGVKLGRLVSFNESEGGSPIPYPVAMRAEGYALDEKSVAPDIQPGSQEVKVFVSVTYEVL